MCKIMSLVVFSKFIFVFVFVCFFFKIQSGDQGGN